MFEVKRVPSVNNSAFDACWEVGKTGLEGGNYPFEQLHIGLKLDTSAKRKAVYKDRYEDDGKSKVILEIKFEGDKVGYLTGLIEGDYYHIYTGVYDEIDGSLDYVSTHDFELGIAVWLASKNLKGVEMEYIEGKGPYIKYQAQIKTSTVNKEVINEPVPGGRRVRLDVSIPE